MGRSTPSLPLRRQAVMAQHPVLEIHEQTIGEVLREADAPQLPVVISKDRRQRIRFVLDQLHRDLDPLPLHAVTLLHVAAVRRARRLGTAHPAPQDISQMRCLGPVPERLTPSAPPAFPPARTPGSSTSAR